MRSIFASLLFSAGLLMGIAADAAEKNRVWDIDMDHSTVGFRIRHIVGFVPGVFAKFSGQVEFDPDRPQQGQFYLLIDSSSVHTGVPKRDEHLRSSDFLDVVRSPKIIFSSRKIMQLAADEMIVVGDLTIRDVTAEVRVPLRVLGIADHPFVDQMPDTRVLGLRAEFSINRLLFHVGEEKWTTMGVMGETIDLIVDMELLQRK